MEYNMNNNEKHNFVAHFKWVRLNVQQNWYHLVNNLVRTLVLRPLLMQNHFHATEHVSDSGRIKGTGFCAAVGYDSGVVADVVFQQKDILLMLFGGFMTKNTICNTNFPNSIKNPDNLNRNPPNTINNEYF